MTTLFTARLAGTQAEMGAQHGAAGRRRRASPARVLSHDARARARRRRAGRRRSTARGRAQARDGVAGAARDASGRPSSSRAVARVLHGAAGVPEDGRCSRSRRWTRCRTASSLAARGKLGPFANRRSRCAPRRFPRARRSIAWGDATADGELLFARNFDFPGVGVWDAAPAFIVCAPDRRPALRVLRDEGRRHAGRHGRQRGRPRDRAAHALAHAA